MSGPDAQALRAVGGATMAVGGALLVFTGVCWLLDWLAERQQG